MPASILDVAKYITKSSGEMSAMKLQKLAYYCQAWHMVWDDQELFAEDFQAWANGPVAPSLYEIHRGMFQVNPELFKKSGKVSNLSKDAKNSIDKVLSFYGTKSAFWLSNLTHQEDPWKNARDGLPAGASSTAIIPKSSMAEYYGSL
ncbi:Panacea domain-containing protein [Stenotrophomonas pavanii]|uniref:Panacea domain-containing protein n=1 Tax=Stenotrophomonas pavanii TaxID=487698 RepID=UPI0039C6ACDE